MTDGKHNSALSAAYASTRPDEVAAIYDRWSET
ncbi:SAM-dependent methyltransferase, partial [Mesorhizobium sp. M00.F.Ca.ET.149.01.1.1]